MGETIIKFDSEREPPVLFLLDKQMRPTAELPLVALDATVELNAAGEMNAEVYTGNDPGLDSLLMPWMSTCVLVAEGVPLWGGVVTRRRWSLNRPTVELVLREWSHWLSKVWCDANTEYIAPANAEHGGLIAWKRVQSAVELAEEFDVAAGPSVIPPLVLGGWINQGSVPIEIDFEDQTFESSPRTFADELEQLSQYGIDWHMPWKVDGLKYLPQFATTVYNGAGPKFEVDLFSDVSSTEIVVDGDLMSNRVRVVGSDEVTASRTASNSRGFPLLASVKSYDSLMKAAATDIEAQNRINLYADILLEQLRLPVTEIATIDMPGLWPEVKPGTLLSSVLGSSLDRRYPNGLEVVSRVQSVKYTLSADSDGAAHRMTTVNSAALWDSLPNVPGGGGAPQNALPSRLPPEDLTKYLSQVLRRVESLEPRRWRL